METCHDETVVDNDTHENVVVYYLNYDECGQDFMICYLESC